MFHATVLGMGRGRTLDILRATSVACPPADSGVTSCQGLGIAAERRRTDFPPHRGLPRSSCRRRSPGFMTAASGSGEMAREDGDWAEMQDSVSCVLVAALWSLDPIKVILLHCTAMKSREGDSLDSSAFPAAMAVVLAKPPLWGLGKRRVQKVKRGRKEQQFQMCGVLITQATQNPAEVCVESTNLQAASGLAANSITLWKTVNVFKCHLTANTGRTHREHTANTRLPSAFQTGPPQPTSDQAAGVGAKLCRDGKLARQFQALPRCVSLGPPGNRRMTRAQTQTSPRFSLLSRLCHRSCSTPARQLASMWLLRVETLMSAAPQVAHTPPAPPQYRRLGRQCPVPRMSSHGRRRSLISR